MPVIYAVSLRHLPQVPPERQASVKPSPEFAAFFSVIHDPFSSKDKLALRDFSTEFAGFARGE